MIEPLWLTLHDVVDLHGEQLEIFGGLEGVRDSALLESVLARPTAEWNDGMGDLAVAAACYVLGIAKGRPFVDGNKRAAFAAMMIFLRANGVNFAPDHAQATVMIVEAAEGGFDDAGVASWIADRMPVKP